MSQHTPVVIISGAASGMGRATAMLLADAGYTVESCDAVVTESVAQVDVRDGGAVQRWVDSVVARHGSVDAVVSNFTAAHVEEMIVKSGLQIVENIRDGCQALVRALRADTVISAVSA